MKSVLIAGAVTVGILGLGACAVPHDTIETSTPPPAPAPAAAAPEQAAPAPAPAPAGISEGVWLVGEDVAPGRYCVTAAVSGDCYWEITTSGGTIVDNDFVSGGRPTVTLKAGQQFKTQGCGDWAKA